MRAMRTHVDNTWITIKTNGHGNSYFYSSITGLAIIKYIGNKNRIQVFGYNVILFFKYLKRKFVV